MSKQIKTNELQCLFDDAVVSAKHSARAFDPPNGRATVVNVSLRSAIFPESVLVNADLVSLEDQLESVSHQFHRQLVQITYGTYYRLISAVLLKKIAALQINGRMEVISHFHGPTDYTQKRHFN